MQIYTENSNNPFDRVPLKIMRYNKNGQVQIILFFNKNMPFTVYDNIIPGIETRSFNEKVTKYIKDPGRLISWIDITGEKRTLGSGVEEEIKGIEEKLLEKENKKIKGIVLPFIEKEVVLYHDDRSTIFPDDSIAILKDKIYSTIGIPIYRQHLEIVQPNFSANLLSYEILRSDIIYPISISSIWSDNSYKILGVPIDPILNNSGIKGKVSINAYDNSTLLNENADIILLDLADFMPNTILDTYQLNSIYYGFVLKYFPLMSLSVFEAYLSDEVGLITKYPNLAPMRHAVTERIGMGNKLSNSPVLRQEFYYFISNAIGSVYSKGLVIINQLYDTIHCSKKIIDIGLTKEKKIISRKVYKSNSILDTETGLGKLRLTNIPISEAIFLIYVPTEDQEILVKIDKKEMQFIFTFTEEEKVSYANLNEIGTTAIKDFMKVLGIKIYGKNPNLLIHKVSISLLWNHNIKTGGQLIFKNILDPYVTANYVSMLPNGNFIILRGISRTDNAVFRQLIMSSRLIESNMYAYLFDSTIWQKWLHSVAGREVEIQYRAASVLFKIYGLYQDEFNRIINYIGQMTQKVKGHSESESNYSRLSRLRELDPKLYDIKRQGSDTVYAVKCQKPYQPYLYGPNEVVPSSAVKYWNFTLNSPAYYSCPKGLHLRFIKNGHPNGYCLPCCAKLEQESRETYNNCLKHHTVTNEENASATFIMTYGNSLLPANRLMRFVPGSFRDLLMRTCPEYEPVLYGVPQTFGPIEAAVKILGTTVSEFGRKIAAAIEDDIIDPGDAAIYFGDKKSFAAFFANLINENIPKSAGPFIRKIIVNCISIVYSVQIIYILVSDTEKINLVLSPSKSENNLGIILETSSGLYYPVQFLGQDNRFLVPESLYNIFDNGGQVSQHFNLDFYLSQFDVKLIYVSRLGLAYGISFLINGILVYCPVSYSEIGDIKVTRITTGPEGMDINYVPTMISEINKKASTILGTVIVQDADIYVKDILIGILTNIGIIYTKGNSKSNNKRLNLDIDPRNVLSYEEDINYKNNWDSIRSQLYKYYEYQLFCRKFMEVATRIYKNDDIHKKLNDVGNKSYSEILKFLGLETMTLADYNRIIEKEYGGPFDFDKEILLNALRTITKEDIIKIMQPVIEIGTGKVPQFLTKKIEGNLLISQSLTSLADILQRDLKQPLKLQYIVLNKDMGTIINSIAEKKVNNDEVLIY